MTITQQIKKTTKPRTRPRIYLAGKVNGRKWQVASGVEGRAFFVASDYKNHEHGQHVTPSFHGMSKNGFSDDGDKTSVYNDALCPVLDADFVVAYLDTADSFGSIAEIAYASAFGKKCILLVLEDRGSFKVVDDEVVDAYGQDSLFDAYWFVSCFPHVETVTVSSIQDAQKRLGEIIDRESRELLHTALYESFESPLEKKFFDDLLKGCTRPYRLGLHGGGCIHVGLAVDGVRFDVIPQYEVQLGKSYRLDFLLLTGALKLVVEIDGHDFHEKTKEQARRDKERDRALVRTGYTVLRYTGSEIYHDSRKAVDEVLSFIKNQK